MKELTAKEEAKAIVQKYENIVLLKDFGGMDLELAKECAIMEFNGRIEELQELQEASMFCSWRAYADRLLYLNVIIQEIKKL
ncbi:MAG: hypothetical protein ACOVNU_04065 [Candidatus Kapaibacteriota bacterium]